MTAGSMTSRERVIASLRGEARDAIPFDAKSVCDGTGRSLSLREVRRLLDSDPIRLLRAPIEADYGRIECSSQETVRSRRRHYRLSGGELSEVEGRDPSTGTWHPTEHLIKSRHDVQLATELYRGMRYVVDDSELAAYLDTISREPDVFTCVSVPPTALMDLVQYGMGIETFTYFSADCPDEVAALMTAMDERKREYLELVMGLPGSEYVRTVENTSTNLISAGMFETFAVPALVRTGTTLRRNGKEHILHMCGKIRAFLPAIDAIPAIAIEAYQSTPIGDTVLADGVRECPSKALIGGIAGTIWSSPTRQIVDRILSDLRAAGDARRIVLGNAGGMLEPVELDTMKAVIEGVRAEVG